MHVPNPTEPSVSCRGVWWSGGVARFFYDSFCRFVAGTIPELPFQ